MFVSFEEYDILHPELDRLLRSISFTFACVFPYSQKITEHDEGEVGSCIFSLARSATRCHFYKEFGDANLNGELLRRGRVFLLLFTQLIWM